MTPSTGKPMLIPAILAQTVEGLLAQAERVAPLSDLIHYDVADGRFVSTQTPPPSDYPHLTEGKRIIWHLMVEEPDEFLDACLQYPTERIILHAESRGLEAALTILTEREIPAGLALNPRTRVAEITQLLREIPYVQVMTVEPGAQGHAFQPTLLTKITQLREAFPALQIAVDGGLNSATIESVSRYHPDYVVVGSALTEAEDPNDEYRILTRLTSINL